MRLGTLYFSQITEDPFVVKKCVLLVLRPNLFLPENRPLFINTRRALRVPGGPSITESGGPSWAQYHAKPDSPYLVNLSGQEFTEFDYKSQRPQGQGLSVFSLLVNANSKLQATRQRSDNPLALYAYIGLVKLAVDAIFFVPGRLQHQHLSVIPPVPSLQSGQHPGITTPELPAQSRGDSMDVEGQDPSDVGRGGGIVEAEFSGSDIDFDDSDDDSEEDSEEDDEPNTINGLTSSEMETVLQRVSDGTISADERTEAAMLMLGMAGGELSILYSFVPSF